MKLTGILAATVAVTLSLIFASAARALDFVQPGGPWTLEGDWTEAIAAGDLNGDGRDDLVAVETSPDRIAVMLANPDGTLASPVYYAAPASQYSITLADLTSNGDLDVVTAGSGRILAWLGSGDGTFGSPNASPAPGYDGILVEAGQFNTSPRLDVIVGDYISGVVELFQGVPPANFVPTGSYVVGSLPSGATVGDFNEDGVDDFALANFDSFVTDALTLVLVDGNGDFDSSSLAGDYQPRDVTNGDFNDDGHLDLAAVNSPNTSLTVKLGSGDGAFSDAPSLPAIPSRNGEPIASGDFDGDGFDDLAVGWGSTISGENGFSTGIYLGSASGEMTAAANGPWANTLGDPAQIALGDFNGDGHLDMANANLSGIVSIFLNAVPGLSVDPGSIDFGGVQVGSTDSDAVELDNVGTSLVQIPSGGVKITGADEDQFSIGADGCDGSTLAPTGGCSVQVRFSPDSLGSFSAALEIESDASEDPIVVPLTGSGVPNPAIGIAPESIDYGTRLVGDGPSAVQDFTIASTGTTPATITSIDTSGDASDFVVDSSDCEAATLPPGDTCAIGVAFDPASVGAKTITVSASIELSNTPAVATADGEGREVTKLTLSPASRDFGTRLTDAGFGGPQEFSVANVGGTVGVVSSVGLSGPDAGSWRVAEDGCSGVSLVPGESCVVGVEFGPVSAGEKSGSLDVAVDGVDGALSASLTGSGQVPVPPPDPCEPVAVKKVAHFTPRVKKRSNVPGVRARITTAGPAVVRVSSKVIYRLNGRQGQVRFKQRQFEVKAGSVNYKVAIPRKLRKGLRPKKRVRFVITYASRAAKPGCKTFGKKKTRNLTTRIVWVIPNA